MADVWDEITERENGQEYPVAIALLERLLGADPNATEAVVRLGFDYWLAMAEADRLGLDVPVQTYARRFLALLKQHEESRNEPADFCWAYGLPLSLHYYYFATDGTNAAELESHKAHGERLLERAAALDGLYAKLQAGEATQEEVAERFRGRGSFAGYYGVVWR